MEDPKPSLPPFLPTGGLSQPSREIWGGLVCIGVSMNHQNNLNSPASFKWRACNPCDNLISFLGGVVGPAVLLHFREKEMIN